MCSDQNWCQSQPCQNNAVCADRTYDFECLCAAGFYGTLCEGLCGVFPPIISN